MSNEIPRLLAMSEDDLYAQLGREMGAALGPRDLVRRGREVMNNCWQHISESICGSPTIRALAQGANRDDAELAAALADCIGGALTGVSPYTVAVLILKRGLPKLCKETWV